MSTSSLLCDISSLHLFVASVCRIRWLHAVVRVFILTATVHVSLSLLCVSSDRTSRRRVEKRSGMFASSGCRIRSLHCPVCVCKMLSLCKILPMLAEPIQEIKTSTALPESKYVFGQGGRGLDLLESSFLIDGT